LVSGDALFFFRRDQLITLAARHAVPAIYEWRENTAAGGLMSYGPSITDLYRQLGENRPRSPRPWTTECAFRTVSGGGGEREVRETKPLFEARR